MEPTKEVVIKENNELATVAAAAAAKAEIEASYTMAMHRPRAVEQARERILGTCTRERFAEKALYKRPVGSKLVDGEWVEQYATGLSIRAAEEVARLWGNIRVLARAVFDDKKKRIVSVNVYDLETNTIYSSEVVIEKVIERRKIKPAQEKVYERTTSRGHVVFGVKPTAEELEVKQNALISKAIRNNILRLIPADIKEEIADQVKNTLSKDASNQQRRLVEAFGELGISPQELEKYLGSSLEHITPDQIADLRAIWQTIKEGDATWQDYLPIDVEVTGQRNITDMFHPKPEQEAKKKPAPKGKNKKPSPEVPEAPPLTIESVCERLNEIGSVPELEHYWLALHRNPAFVALPGEDKVTCQRVKDRRKTALNALKTN